MAINFYAASVNDETVHLAPESINFLRYPDSLPEGHHGFIDRKAVWVHPDTDVPYVDGQAPVMTLEGALEEGFEIENLARLINFLKQLAVDVTYVTEYQSKLAAEELPDQKEIVTYSVFDTAPRIGLDQLEALSLPVGGIVDDSFTLGALNAHLIEIYGEDAALGPVSDTVTEE